MLIEFLGASLLITVSQFVLKIVQETMEGSYIVIVQLLKIFIIIVYQIGSLSVPLIYGLSFKSYNYNTRFYYAHLTDLTVCSLYQMQCKNE
jgi:hypothetical protein